MKISSIPIIRYFRLNPVTLYELRHVINGRIFHRVLALLLLMMLGVAALVVTASSAKGEIDSNTAEGFLTSILSCLALASLLVLPAMSAARLLAERAGGELDLLLITGLTPKEIIGGKLLSSVLLNLLLFSSALPFITFLSLFRGIGLAPALWRVLALFIILFPVVAVALLLASLQIPRPARIILLIFGLGGIFFVVMPMVAFLFGSFRLPARGIFSYVVLLTVFSAISLIATVVFSLAAIAALSPPAFDRARPVRLAVSFFCVLSFGLGLIFPRSTNNVEIWLIIWSLVFSAAMIASISERDLPSPRQTGEITGSPAYRGISFLFSSGSLNGLVWSVLSGWLCVLVAMSSDCDSQTLPVATGILLWGLVASLTGYLLHRRTPIGQKIRTAYAWILPAALLGFLGIVESIAEVFVSGSNGLNDLTHWRILNPVFIFDHEILKLWLILGPALALVLVLISLPEIKQRLSAWRPGGIDWDEG